MAEQESAIGPGAFVVGTATGQAAQHAGHQRRIRLAAVDAQLATDAAHPELSLKRVTEGNSDWPP